MNCFEFRRQCVAEPRATAEAYRRHRSECAACAAFAREQESFERALSDAVGIEVPAGLDARIILRQTTRHGFRMKRTFAYAASVLVVVGTVMGILWTPGAPDVDALVMDHILDEPEHLMVQDNVPRARVAAVMAEEGVALRGDLGPIRFVARCPGRVGVHLVLAGTRGPVTVMIMPKQPVSAPQIVERGGLSGVVVSAGTGSLAIVGLPGEPIAEHERRVRAAIAGLT